MSDRNAKILFLSEATQRILNYIHIIQIIFIMKKLDRKSARVIQELKEKGKDITYFFVINKKHDGIFLGYNSVHDELIFYKDYYEISPNVFLIYMNIIQCNSIIRYDIEEGTSIVSKGSCIETVVCATLFGSICSYFFGLAGIICAIVGIIIGLLCGAGKNVKSDIINIYTKDKQSFSFNLAHEEGGKKFQEDIAWWRQFIADIVDKNNQQKAIDTDLRPCPMCAEPIRPEAKKCRFCGEFLVLDQHEKSAHISPNASPSQKYIIRFKGEIQPTEHKKHQQDILNKLAGAANMSVESLMTSEMTIKNLSEEKALNIQEQMKRLGIIVYIEK